VQFCFVSSQKSCQGFNRSENYEAVGTYLLSLQKSFLDLQVFESSPLKSKKKTIFLNGEVNFEIKKILYENL